MEDLEHELKVLVVGNGGVGKTGMIKRFCKNLYTDEYKKTIGVDFLEKCVYVDALGEEVRFMLWDTGGAAAAAAAAPAPAAAANKMKRRSLDVPDVFVGNGEPLQGLPKRKSREGQAPPQKPPSNRGSTRRRQQSTAAVARAAPEEDAIASRAEREHAAWQASKGPMRHSFISSFSSRALSRRKAAISEQQALQNSVSQAWKLHACCQQASTPECGEQLPPFLTCVDVRHTKYISKRTSGSLQLPRWHCAQCNSTMYPDLISFDAFPGTPSFPETVYHQEVLEEYEHLGLRCGVSAHKFLEGIQKQHNYMLCDDIGQPVHQDINLPSESAFFSTFMGYLAVKERTCSLDALGILDGRGPLVDCPICANTPGAPACHIAVAADAVTKVGHFSGAAQATKHLPAAMSTHYGPANQEVQAMQQGGRCNLQSFVDGRDTEGISEGKDPCTAALHCSRQESTPTGTLDVNGTVGFVCMHTIPLRQVFVDMPAPEQWLYYLNAFSHLLRSRPDVNDCYLDFACKLRVTWERFREAHPDLELPSVRLLVPWFHASSHGIDCQLQSNALFALSAGRRVGENTEQLFSMLKVISGIVRYMRHGHRQDFIDACLSAIAEEKLPQIAALLDCRHKATTQILENCTKEAEALSAAAFADGVTDLSQAIVSFVLYVLPESDARAESDYWAVRMEYVELLVKLWGAQAVDRNKHTMAAVSAASTADLMSKAQYQQLQARVARFEDAHQIFPGDWQPESPEYQHARGKLVEKKVMEYRQRVEQTVLELRALYARREQLGPACKESDGLMKKYRGKRTRLNDLLREMGVWGEHVTEEQVKTFLKDGTAPWISAASSTSFSSIHHGRLLHRASNAIARCREELGFLKQERARLQHWTAWCTDRVKGELGVEACSGRQFWLKKWLLVIESVARDVSSLRW